ncbi:hypothetical protein FDP25_04885 [Roseovarius sp. A21]|uniref:Dihaem cytochrome c n=1 Tax=Roseovarius bejariae TaxID=2576383 RepID=A0A844CXF5_9RHOB|nr:hypothetical protein [Roseovarius bejariae]MRU14764.1 hypothetical protein [Roseovarius bejariae]
MRWSLLIAVPVCLATVLWAEEDQFAFIPDGGRSLLAGLVAGLEPDARHSVLTRKAGSADWADWARAQAPDMAETPVETLAGYAALNLPLAEVTDEDWAAQLPPDGKDLAIAQCQFCHSLFTGYLMHDRDLTGWKGTFKAPFHTEIPMNEVERDTFASYSALNMPLSFEDVPPEWRF